MGLQVSFGKQACSELQQLMVYLGYKGIAGLEIR